MTEENVQLEQVLITHCIEEIHAVCACVCRLIAPCIQKIHVCKLIPLCIRKIDAICACVCRLTPLCIRKIDAISSCFAGLGLVPPLRTEHRAQIVSVRSRRQPDARREPS